MVDRCLRAVPLSTGGVRMIAPPGSVDDVWIAVVRACEDRPRARRRVFEARLVRARDAHCGLERRPRCLVADPTVHEPRARRIKRHRPTGHRTDLDARVVARHGNRESVPKGLRERARSIEHDTTALAANACPIAHRPLHHLESVSCARIARNAEMTGGAFGRESTSKNRRLCPRAFVVPISRRRHSGHNGDVDRLPRENRRKRAPSRRRAPFDPTECRRDDAPLADRAAPACATRRDSPTRVGSVTDSLDDKEEDVPPPPPRRRKPPNHPLRREVRQ